MYLPGLCIVNTILCQLKTAESLLQATRIIFLIACSLYMFMKIFENVKKSNTSMTKRNLNIRDKERKRDANSLNSVSSLSRHLNAEKADLGSGEG